MPNNNEQHQNEKTPPKDKVRFRPKFPFIDRLLEKLIGPPKIEIPDQNKFENKVVVEKLDNNEIQITAISINECGVTGLRFVNDSFRKELLNFSKERLLNGKKSLLLFSIDLRNLKKLNDDLGHDGANVAIKSYVENIRAEISSQVQGTDIEFVFYRPQSGGDEFYILFTGEDDLLHKLEEELPQVLYEIPCEGEDRDKRAVTVPVGGEFGVGSIDAQIPITEQILTLEFQLNVPPELAFNIAEADDFAKVSHLYELIKEQANRILDEKKFAELVKEIVGADDLFQGILIQIEDPQQDRNAEEENLQAEKIAAVFQKLEHDFALKFGSRRLTPMGAQYIFQLGSRLGVIRYKLDLRVPLSVKDEVLLGIITQDQGEQLEMMARAAIIGSKGRPDLQRELAANTYR